MELLRGMLETMSADGSINEVSYVYAIEKWVNNVRSLSQSPDTVYVSQKESDSEVCIICTSRHATLYHLSWFSVSTCR